ncbi:hypothetical protein EYZ11_003379 [Aspergillus tanneri]|uniref:Nephrocystin 3-like N-terminal domain-containing protein n=1 Tax=Aspergillus tanneri TaxID=1220188 RepID=A0A4V3UQ63_9EURO|nr:hypothetical protein EYZ11_003379 [Aspergillus tanneri]
MYRSLLLQLLEEYPDLHRVLDSFDLQGQNGCPPLNVLKDLFCDAVFLLDQRLFTCFVDALDECDEQQVVDMVQYFEELAERSTARGILLRICFSSRHYPYIVIRRGSDLHWRTSQVMPMTWKPMLQTAFKSKILHLSKNCDPNFLGKLPELLCGLS